jgi:hypothetical protein
LSPVFSTYRVISRAKPATAFSRPGGQLILRFPTVDHGLETVTIRELVEKAGSETVPVGLEFRAEVQAGSIDEGIGRGVGLADGVASFITLATGVGMPKVEPVLCYEITQGKSQREFLQYFDDVIVVNPSRKVLAPELLIDRIDRFYKVPDAIVSERIARAVRWYRWGTGTADQFDRFVAYWLGLESLNKPLQERLGVGDDPTKCPECGNEWVPTPTVSGIREFVGRFFAEDKRLYQRMHALRISVMHSKATLDSLSAEVAELTPISGNALLAAILYLISIDPPWDFPTQTITNASPFRIAVVTKLLCEKVEDAMLEQEDPHFRAEHTLLNLSLNREAGGKLVLTVTSRLTAVIGPKAQFDRNYSWRVYGEGKGELAIQNVTVEKASVQ